MTRRDVKLSPEKTWVASSNVFKIVSLTIGATAAVMIFHFRMASIEATMDRDIISRAAERKADELARQQERESDRIARSQEKIAVVQSVNEVRDDLRKLLTESVNVKRLDQWIENQRLLNKDKAANVVWSDIPR